MPTERSAEGAVWTEQQLRGPGAGEGVVRIGDTVRRADSQMPSGAIATLQHLEAVGFPGAPRYRGRDELGRHVLDFVEGEVAIPPLPAWVADDALLVSVGSLLRDYHEALGRVSWAGTDLAWGHPPPGAYVGSIPCHLDVSPSNVVCRDRLAAALIDFEEVALAQPIWDVARTVRHWVPMLAPADLVGAWACVAGRQLERLAMFLDAYGLEERDRLRLPNAIVANADATYNRMRSGAAAGHPLYAQQYYGGDADRNRCARTWMAEIGGQITEAIRGGVL